MVPPSFASKGRKLLDDKLTELALLAKKLCPAAKVEINTRRYEDEDGRLKILPPLHLSEVEVEALEEASTEKCNEILEQTNLFILCAVFDSQPWPGVLRHAKVSQRRSL